MLKSKELTKGFMLLVLAGVIGLMPFTHAQAQDKKNQAAPARMDSMLSQEDQDKIRTIQGQIQEKNNSLKSI